MIIDFAIGLYVGVFGTLFTMGLLTVAKDREEQIKGGVNLQETIKELQEKSEDYISALEETISESECKDCNGNYKACRFCRLEILNDLKENLVKLNS